VNLHHPELHTCTSHVYHYGELSSFDHKWIFMEKPD